MPRYSRGTAPETDLLETTLQFDNLMLRAFHRLLYRWVLEIEFERIQLRKSMWWEIVAI
jgi:hypothetical protein